MPKQTIEGYPLTSQQKRLWYFYETWKIPAITRVTLLVEGRFETVTFENALRTLVRRHEILRTEFERIEDSGQPVQVVNETDAIATVKEINVTPWMRGPILRCRVTSIATERAEVELALPALTADTESARVLVKELAAAYGDSAGAPEANGEPMQYLDYGQWQADLSETGEAAASNAYWTKRYTSEMWRVPLQTCDPHQEFTEDAIEIPADIIGAGGTPGKLFAAWAAFLCRLTERSELTVGLHSSGRNFQELDGAIGLYERFLPIPIKLNQGTTGDDLARASEMEQKLASQHAEFLGSARSDRPDSYEPMAFLFKSSTEYAACDAGGARFSITRIESSTEPFTLFLDCSPNRVTLRFNSAVLPPEAAELIAKRFETFAKAYNSMPDDSISTVPLVSEAERELLLGKFAKSGAAKLGSPTVLDLFYETAALHPQRPAVIWNESILSYGELDARSNQLAQHLLKLGVHEGTPVALSAERSFEMIVGVLGILKAGGAYVPIDPAYPRDRIRFVLDDCGARALVIQPHLIANFPEHHCKTIALAATHSALQQESPERPRVRIPAAALAYIIYTSGSTGQPKGVPITHHNLGLSTAARIEYYKEPIANYLLLSSFAFDSSIAGIFWCLTQGATLTLPAEGSHAEPRELLRLMAAYKVSHLLALPSLYNALLEQSRDGEMNGLRTVIVAGEASTPALVQRHYKQLPQATLYNEYGPTEATVWSTVHRCEAVSAHGTVPIGRPVPNTAIYILDPKMDLVPIGAQGEIHIAGEALSTGYLNRSDLTAAKFVPHPFDHGTRLYKTGDLGRFRLDGTIEFLGRIDQQVKIRGYRIELGEIESTLLAHPAVKEAAVLAREDSPGEKRLVAYLTVRNGMDVSAPDLRLHLQRSLPAFMVPAHFSFLNVFPQTPNGKLDRNALPAPEELEKAATRSYTAPRNRDEEILARIWAEVLKLERVGAEENFFDLGGHSLLAIQVIARVRDSLNVEIPMRTLFDTPTVAGMAAALDHCRRNPSTQSPIRRSNRSASSAVNVVPASN